VGRYPQTLSELLAEEVETSSAPAISVSDNVTSRGAFLEDDERHSLVLTGSPGLGDRRTEPSPQ
jgi:hypothetical protein